MTLPELYGLGNLRFQLISKAGDSTIFTVSVLPTEPAEEVPYMQHRWTLTMLATLGVVEVFSGQRWQVLQYHREFLVPPHALHAFRNTRRTPAKLCLIARPDGFEEYVKEHSILLQPEEFVQISCHPEIYRVDKWRAVQTASPPHNISP